MKNLLIILMLWSMVAQGQSNLSAQRLERNTKSKVTNRVKPILKRLCASNCEIVDIQVAVQPKISDGQDMGVESTLADGQNQELEVKNISIEIQIDSRITEENKQRLERIVLLNLKSMALGAEVNWSQIMLPRIGGNKGSLDGLKQTLETNIRSQIKKVINRYCPDQCILEEIEIRGEALTKDQSRVIPQRRVVKGLSGDMNMRVDSVNVDITMDEGLSEKKREKIAEILRARTRFVEPIDFGVNVTPFPETYLSEKERLRKETDDPHGLEKLRQTLIMFRELAGTKEIITSSTTEQTSQFDRSSSTESRSESSSGSSLPSFVFR